MWLSFSTITTLYYRVSNNQAVSLYNNGDKILEMIIKSSARRLMTLKICLLVIVVFKSLYAAINRRNSYFKNNHTTFLFCSSLVLLLKFGIFRVSADLSVIVVCLVNIFNIGTTWLNETMNSTKHCVAKFCMKEQVCTVFYTFRQTHSTSTICVSH